MNLINADVAYANSLLARQKNRRLIFDDLAIYFNNQVNKNSKKGNMAIIFRWTDFGLNEDFATEEELTAELLENILAAGYEAEFCYCSPGAYNPCGIAVGWGKEAEERIKLLIEETAGLYRGDENGTDEYP